MFLFLCFSSGQYQLEDKLSYLRVVNTYLLILGQCYSQAVETLEPNVCKKPMTSSIVPAFESVVMMVR